MERARTYPAMKGVILAGGYGTRIFEDSSVRRP
jgi:hypothetical protein